VFYTYSQISTSTDMLLFVKATNAQRLAQPAVQVIHDIDSKIPVTEVRLLEEAFGESISRERLGAVVSSAFALTALLLAACGVYGLLSFRIAERRQEIGIRMALGAKASSVLWMVMRHGFQLVLPAVLLGLAGAFALSQWLESFLFEVTPHDPVTFVGVVTLLVAISAVATFAPARRATQVDPLIVLREE
jgi:putative ABC transport system permease protein